MVEGVREGDGGKQYVGSNARREKGTMLNSSPEFGDQGERGLPLDYKFVTILDREVGFKRTKRGWFQKFWGNNI
jgi:hypothetical protein